MQHTDSKPEQLPKSTASFRILWRALRYLRFSSRKVIGIYGTMVLIQGITVATPQVIRWLIDEGIYGGDLGLLNLAVAVLLVLTLIKGFLTFNQGRWTEEVSQTVAFDLRNEIQTKLNTLSFSFHAKTETGQILSRSIQDVERLRFLTGRAVLRIIEGVVLLVVTISVLFSMNTNLAWLVLLTLPLLANRAFALGKTLRPLSIRIQDQLGVLTTRIEQNLRGAQVVKAFAQEDREVESFLVENEKWFELSASAARVQAVNAPMLTFIANLGTLFIIGYGGVLVMQGSLSLGELVAFTTYLGQLVRPVNLMGRIIPILAIATSSGERIFEILDAIPDVDDHPTAKLLENLQGEVAFDRVSFKYAFSRNVLNNIHFSAAPGEIIALLGLTGSGKSTLINLIARFYDATDGHVRIDGQDVRKIQLRSLRQNIGIVLQDTVLFAASIRENIAFGCPDASEDAIIQAAKDAQAHDFILETPDGYETRVGERGTTLSGGQKQRIAIARALLTDPRILILDDATSSVDTQTERLIQQALDRLMKGRTTFVIAHRLSTIRRADRILVLKDGQISAQGKHDTLLATSPLYSQLYDMQLRPQETQTRKEVAQ